MNADLVAVFKSLARQSGMGLVFAIVCGYAVIQVYSDLRESNRVLIELVRQNGEAVRSMTSAINSFSIRIDAHEQRMRTENFR